MLKKTWQVTINYHLDYIDFFRGEVDRPDRVYGCSKYRKELQEYLDNLFKRIEQEYKTQINVSLRSRHI